MEHILHEFFLVHGYIQKDTGRKNDLYVIYFDFDKADQYLFTKLANYGIEGNLLYWIMFFLKNRKQRVVMGDSVSNWAPFFSEIQQGSVLGP